MLYRRQMIVKFKLECLYNVQLWWLSEKQKKERRDMTDWLCIPTPQSMLLSGSLWPIFTTCHPTVQQEWRVSRDTAYKWNKILIRKSSRNYSVAVPINIGNMERILSPNLFTPLVSECFILSSFAWENYLLQQNTLFLFYFGSWFI